MKKNYLLSAAAAFLLAAMGCSDDIDNGGNSGGEDDGNNAYMTVHISTVADGLMTKAGDPTKPSNPNVDENGKTNGAGWGEDGNGWLGELPGKNEGMVHNINIFLFSTTESQLSLTSTNQLDFFNSADGSIKVDGHGWLSLGSAVDASTGGNEPNHGSRNIKITMKEDLGETEQNFQVFAIVNAGENLDDINTLSALRDYMEDEDVIKSNEANVATADKFVMSTHKMVSNATTANLPSIVTLSSKNTAENPAQTSVYVERLAARVDLAYPENGDLEFSNADSPVNGQGNFKLTGYMLINQWQGQTNMFKQVSPSVADFTEALTESATYAESDPKKYLGDEVWKWTTAKQEAGTYNFVLSDGFVDKKTDEMTLTDSKWDTSYKNHFSTSLNTSSLVQILPLTDGVSYEENSRTYFPIAYVRENTLNTTAQVNGYTTGMIFKTQFVPGDNFKMNKYENGSIKVDGLTDAEKISKKFVFLTAEHYDGKKASKLVYRDVKTVAARAFNIPESDTKSLLKGFMEGWGESPTATLAEVKDAVSKMSEKNLLSKKFKDYLNGKLGEATDLTAIKGDLTYAKFVSTQGAANQAVLNMEDLNNITTDQIGILAQEYGVSLFRDGQSYHKFWIRHNDNLDDYKMGVMEFCIVRNNVYQLFVKGVKGLGDPLPYTPGKDDPGTPDENNEITIDVTIYVKDWVKRTNKDIIL